MQEFLTNKKNNSENAEDDTDLSVNLKMRSMSTLDSHIKHAPKKGIIDFLTY